MYIRQIMYNLNLYNAVCWLYFNAAEEKKKQQQVSMMLEYFCILLKTC